jgi:dihydroxyacid dehydratase/phosphogluconate dehydratase
MFDSLPYRNDAAQVFRRLIRSLPVRSGVMGVATCDKGLPAVMMALAGMRELPSVLVPGGVTLPSAEGEDAGKVQTLGVRYSHGMITMEKAALEGCRACAWQPPPGVLGTAATSQVVSEALGLSLPHSALAPSGQPVRADIAVQSARALTQLESRGLKSKDIVTGASVTNAMTVHAAFGGSTNLLLHIPAIAHAAGLARPTIDDWIAVNRRVPAGLGAAERSGPSPDGARLPRRRRARGDAPPAPARPARARRPHRDQPDARRRAGRVGEVGAPDPLLREQDGVDPDDVILPPDAARARGLTSTVTFPRGNIAPEGSVVKSTAIDPSVLDAQGVLRREGPARVFTSEHEAIAAIKKGQIQAGDILVVLGCGPIGTGMEETYQLTSALRFLPFGKEVALVTDARFSGVSTGACIGHVGPEALAGGPIGKLKEGDQLRIVIDARRLEGSVDFVGEGDRRFAPEEAAKILAARPSRTDVRPHPALPEDTRLWAMQQAGAAHGAAASNDVNQIVERLTQHKDTKTMK